MRIRANRLLGGILLVSGTTIGAGMLAIPVISSFAGFIPSLIALFLCWGFLLTTAFLLLDVTLSFSEEVNLITMASRTLGFPGQAICWLSYLLLLYSLTAAYIAGSFPLFSQAMNWLVGKEVPPWLGPFPLLLLFGIFVYLGTQVVDWVNRLFMAALIFSYLLLIAFLPPHLQLPLLQRSEGGAIWLALPVIITSYGFHIIIPTLTTYLDRDPKKLRQALFIGSLIPFLVYAIWECLILGTVPLEGDHGLVAAWKTGQTGASCLSYILQNNWITTAASSFALFAIITSFLGVSLSLSHFLTDGLHMKRFSLGRELACILTFVPPLLFVLSYPRGFLLALEFAGLFVVILLCLLPAAMSWRLPQYQTLPKKILLLTVVLISLFVIALDFAEKRGMLKSLTEPYLTEQNSTA